MKTSNRAPLSAVVLVSGRGTNLAALIRARDEGRLDLALSGVISNRPEAPGLDIARAAGVSTTEIDHREFPDRASHEAALADQIDSLDPALVILAGYMRILGDDFVRRFEGRMINLHPSLLPLYPGLNTHARAIDAGDGEHGASIHFVTPELDLGPVVAQVRIPMESCETPEMLAARLLPFEHRLLVATVELFCEGRVEYSNGMAKIDGMPLECALQLNEDNHLEPDRR